MRCMNSLKHPWIELVLQKESKCRLFFPSDPPRHKPRGKSRRNHGPGGLIRLRQVHLYPAAAEAVRPFAGESHHRGPGHQGVLGVLAAGCHRAGGAGACAVRHLHQGEHQVNLGKSY